MNPLQDADAESRGEGVPDASPPYFEFQVEKPAALLETSPMPRFPEMLRSANREGGVLVQFVVDTAGRAEMGTFKVLKSSHEGFTQAVKNALPSIRFAPAELQGRKVRQLMQHTFAFSPQG